MIVPKVKILFIVIVVGISFQTERVTKVWAQAAPEQNQDAKKRLEIIRSEIQKYRDLLDAQKKEELSSLDQLDRIDREINLLQDFVRQLKSQESRIKQEIFQSNAQILRLMDDFNAQKEIYADRLVHFYKHRRLGDLEILLSVHSLSQMLVWLKYSQRIAQADQRRLQTLLRTKAAIEKANDKRRNELTELEMVLAEKDREEEQLKDKRNERERVLVKIRKDKKLYTQKIQEYQKAAQEIERLVRESETKRKKLPPKATTPSQFADLKGKMIWPTDGKILNRFGKVKNPNMNTYYINEGVDIQSKLGENVYSTCSGVVTAITWQRGRGNIVIVNHFNGYYTVYTHLAEILVRVGQEVATGEVVGRVGDAGSLSGPMLHFEIWKETNPIDPEAWLGKSG